MYRLKDTIWVSVEHKEKNKQVLSTSRPPFLIPQRKNNITSFPHQTIPSPGSYEVQSHPKEIPTAMLPGKASPHHFSRGSPTTHHLGAAKVHWLAPRKGAFQKPWENFSNVLIKKEEQSLPAEGIRGLMLGHKNVTQDSRTDKVQCAQDSAQAADWCLSSQWLENRTNTHAPTSSPVLLSLRPKNLSLRHPLTLLYLNTP